jgi:hypothetical protein
MHYPMHLPPLWCSQPLHRQSNTCGLCMPIYCCHKCNTPWESENRQPGFKEVCLKCGAYLHCCKNCRFHLPTAHNQCYIPNTEYVVNRTGLNFCEEFAFREGLPQNNAESKKQQQAREGFAGLFGETSGKSPNTSFEDLFKD